VFGVVLFDAHALRRGARTARGGIAGLAGLPVVPHLAEGVFEVSHCPLDGGAHLAPDGLPVGLTNLLRGLLGVTRRLLRGAAGALFGLVAQLVPLGLVLAIGARAAPALPLEPEVTRASARALRRLVIAVRSLEVEARAIRPAIHADAELVLTK